MKRWLIVLCLAAVTAPGCAAAATRSHEEAPLWKRLLAVIVPSVVEVRQPAAAQRHRRQAHAHLAHDAVENSPPFSRAAPRARDRHEHVGLAATGAEENAPPLPRVAPQPPDRYKHVGSAPTGADENAPPLLPAPDGPPVPARSAASSNGCEVGQRIISAYYWQGRRTASGEPFNPQGMTAAHRTLPFGTRVNVINPRTGQSVTVVINDRGPFVRGVGLDLSLAAAKAIGMRGTGTVCIL
jgi:rare lipoprotein A